MAAPRRVLWPESPGWPTSSPNNAIRLVTPRPDRGAGSGQLPEPVQLDEQGGLGNTTEGVVGQPVGQVVDGADGAGVDDPRGALLGLAPGDVDPKLGPVGFHAGQEQRSQLAALGGGHVGRGDEGPVPEQDPQGGVAPLDGVQHGPHQAGVGGNSRPGDPQLGSAEERVQPAAESDRATDASGADPSLLAR